MSDLTEFLLARIAEDEAAARAAGGEDWYTALVPGRAMMKRDDEPQHTVVDSPATLVSYEVTSAEKGEHIARHDPARVLAECEAKRRIVERCSAVDVGMPSPRLAQGIIAEMATAHADHADYRAEWRP